MQVEQRGTRWRLLAVLLGATVLTVLVVHLVTLHLHGALVDGGRRLDTLRVMTWNIGKIYLPVDSRAADRDLDHVAEVIQDVAPHIVAVQELRGPQQLGQLLARLGPAWRGRIPEDRYDRRAALLTRLPARFIELETSTGRVAQGAEITLADEERLTAASVHLDAFDPERRARQAEEIFASMRRLQNDSLLLAGDFNFDPALVARDSADHRLYAFLTRDLIDAGRGQGGTTVIARRLDYVFYRWKAVSRSRAMVLRNRRINTMDHDPIVVELSLAHQQLVQR